jgi:hypothetical protein
MKLFVQELPRVSARYGFAYLDNGPVYVPELDLALVGSINWYDYSWSIEAIRRDFPDEMSRLQSKRFTRGRHNDANFVRWSTDDVAFTADVVRRLEGHLVAALARAGTVIVVTHHPAFPDIAFPRAPGPLALDELLWDAFGGNRRLQDVLTKHADRIAFAFCGHTHRAREAKLGPIQGYNIGGDYHFKRLLMLDWARRTVQAHQFGDAERTS